MKINYNSLSYDERIVADRLPREKFLMIFGRPEHCGFEGALDKRFGCPFIFRSGTLEKHCEGCPCRISDIVPFNEEEL